MKDNPPFIAGYVGVGIVADVTVNPSFTIVDRMAFADVPCADDELVAVVISNSIPLATASRFKLSLLYCYRV